MEIIDTTASLGDVVRRNLPAINGMPEVRLTWEGWRRT
jgi:hypothetical protein